MTNTILNPKSARGMSSVSYTPSTTRTRSTEYPRIGYLISGSLVLM